MLCPETLILELWRALINSVVKHKGISKQEQAVTLNQANPGLSKSERVVIGTWNTKIRCWALCGTEHLETFLKEELVPWSLLHCNYEQCKSTSIRLLITTPVFDFHSVESYWTQHKSTLGVSWETLFILLLFGMVSFNMICNISRLVCFIENINTRFSHAIFFLFHEAWSTCFSSMKKLNFLQDVRGNGT